ncbi:MAG: hypothetical protein LBI20_00515 [Holosporales bacterium]|nr:hypothetical protein [Holosporales bacterium]
MPLFRSIQYWYPILGGTVGLAGIGASVAAIVCKLEKESAAELKRIVLISMAASAVVGLGLGTHCSYKLYRRNQRLFTPVILKMFESVKIGDQ